MIDRFQIERLANLPIEQVAERMGLHVVRHKCLCPFHDDRHPSMAFNTRTNRYRCFVCGEHGRTIDLVMKYLGMWFTEACQWLADGTNIIVENHRKAVAEGAKQKVVAFDAARYERFFRHPVLSQKARRFLFDERRLTETVVQWCGITSWKSRKTGTEWLSIPYYNMERKLIGVQQRNLDFVKGQEDGQPKFRFPTGAACHVYNLPMLTMLKPMDSLWITEGCTDCWALLSTGRRAIAIPSATTLRMEDLQLIRDAKKKFMLRLHMAPDQDGPGERLYEMLQRELPDMERHQLPDGCKDFSEWWMGRNGETSR